MVQQKRKIQKLFPEQKSWFQLETKNALPYAMGKGCRLHVKYIPGTASTNLSALLLFVACELFENGRKNGLNIFLVGPSNCGKRFLLEPLEQIFTCFINPARSKYPWAGLDEA